MTTTDMKSPEERIREMRRSVLCLRLEIAGEIVDDVSQRIDALIDAMDNELELAWGIIANVDSGNWEQRAEWLGAATAWRDRVMPGLSERAVERSKR